MAQILDFIQEKGQDSKLVEAMMYLSTEFIPDTILHRQEEMHYLASMVFSLPFKNQPPANLMVMGESGTGKSLVNKYWYNDIQTHIAEKQIKNIRFFHFTAKNTTTQYDVVKALAHMTDQRFYATLSFEGFFNCFLEYCDTHYEYVVIILDEFHKITSGMRGNVKLDDLLYTLTRARTLGILKKCWLATVIITNRMDIETTISRDVISSFGIGRLHFKPYKPYQIREILLARSKKAFAAGACPPEVVDYIAKLCHADGGDARMAIDTLRYAAQIAEGAGKTLITAKEVDEGYAKATAQTIATYIANLNDKKRVLLYSISCLYGETTKPISFENAYSAYQDFSTAVKLPCVKSGMIRRYLSQFEKSGIIRCYEDGRTRYYVPTEKMPQIHQHLADFFGRKSLESMTFTKSLNGDRHAGTGSIQQI